MGDHVMHPCSVLVPTFNERNPNPYTKIYGWPHPDKIPINTQAHPDGRCPYCDEPLKDMERVDAEDAVLLMTNPHASGARRGTKGNASAKENAELRNELKSIRQEFRDFIREFRASKKKGVAE